MCQASVRLFSAKPVFEWVRAAFDGDDLTLAGCDAGRRVCRDKWLAIVIKLTGSTASSTVENDWDVQWSADRRGVAPSHRVGQSGFTREDQA